MVAVRAARWYARRDVRVEDVPPPRPGPGELLLRVSLCGICGTDLEEYQAGPVVIPTQQPHPLTGRQAPLTLGHEFLGPVVAVGEGVGGIVIGQRVAPEVTLFCGRCFFCRRHAYALCLKWAAIGLHTDGGLAELARVPAAWCAPLPDTVSDEAGALVEPTEVAVRAVRNSGLRLGESAAVLGGGTVGLLTLQVAHAAGASAVYLIEPRPRRRALGRDLGAAGCFDPGQPDWQAGLREVCDGVGPDVVFECAGTRDSADLAIGAARKGGRIVLVGIQGERVPLSTLEIVIGEKHVLGSVQHHYDEDLPAAVRLLAEGQVKAQPLVTGRVPLERVVEDGLLALAQPGTEHLKILVEP